MMPIPSAPRRLVLLFALCLSTSLAAHADDASHRAKATELMALLHTQRMVENVSDALKKQVSEAASKIAGTTQTEASKAKVADFEKKADQMIDAQLGWATMQAGFADIYQKNFTEEQLDGIIAFYKSPAGAAMLEHMPTVTNEVTQFGNSHVSALQPELKQLFEDFQKSMAPASAAPAGGGASSKPASPTPSTPGATGKGK